MDPIEIRRRNALQPGARTVNGQLVPSTALVACLDSVERLSGWKERWNKMPFGRGLGVACSM
jgi:4-hydroxybenzoyl-CoA reductase subunit alpha